MDYDNRDGIDRSRPLDGDSDRDREQARPRLMHLSDASDLQVADGDPDIRGWELRTTDGQEIGKVEDLVVDTNLMRVRFIEGELTMEGHSDRENRRVLIPIESARLDEDDDKVIVDYSTLDASRLPAYDGETMPIADMDMESAFDDRSFFGTRRRGRETSPYISSVTDRNVRDIDSSGTGLR